jgi:hypothetical protein
MAERKKEDRYVHQDYQIEAEKVAAKIWGHSCMDVAAIKVHNHAEANKIVDFLRSLGFAVMLERQTKVTLEEDKFPSED